VKIEVVGLTIHQTPGAAASSLTSDTRVKGWQAGRLPGLFARYAKPSHGGPRSAFQLQSLMCSTVTLAISSRTASVSGRRHLPTLKPIANRRDSSDSALWGADINWPRTATTRWPCTQSLGQKLLACGGGPAPLSRWITLGASRERKFKCQVHFGPD
jgi:hypothetical protein